MNINMRIVCVFICIVFMFSAGCSKQQVNKTGFLDNYDDLGPGRKGGVNLIYLKEGVDFKKYNKIMMDHVVFFFNKNSKYKGVHPDTLKELANAFHEAVAEALEGAYPLVDTPGPDVMRVRVAITDVVPGKPGKTIATTFIPVKTGAKVVFKAVKKVTTNRGTVKYIMRDNETGRHFEMSATNYKKFKLVSDK